MKINQCIVSLIMYSGLFLPHVVLSMKNDSLIPLIRLATTDKSSIMIRNNTCAVKDYDGARVWNLDKLSAKNKAPLFEYYFEKGEGKNYFIDLDDSGTKFLLQGSSFSSRLDCCLNKVHIYDLLAKNPFPASFVMDYFFKIKKAEYWFTDCDGNYTNFVLDASLLYSGNVIHRYDSSGRKLKIELGSTRESYGIKVASFFDTNTIVTSDYDAIHLWKMVQERPTSIPMLITLPVLVKKFTKELSSYSDLAYYFNDPIMAVHQKEKKFAYYIKAVGDQYLTDRTYFVTNHNYDHSNFIFLILRQFLCKDVVYEIVSKIQSSVVQHINTKIIENDTIVCMEYSPDASIIALTGLENSYVCTLQEASRGGKDCITKIPVSGFSTFHPNNKTLFVMDDKERALCGIDIKTKKIIYTYRLSDSIVPVELFNRHTIEQNQQLACNKKGDKIAAAFSKHCQIYDVPESLQYFFNTYDPETVPEIAMKF